MQKPVTPYSANENGVKSALDPCCLIGQDPRGHRSLRIKKKTEKH